ncbi:MAG: hypothetical protein ACRER2_14420 [Methylococcales bacterium]
MDIVVENCTVNTNNAQNAAPARTTGFSIAVVALGSFMNFGMVGWAFRQAWQER